MSTGYVLVSRRVCPRCSSGELGNTLVYDSNESGIMFGIEQTKVYVLVDCNCGDDDVFSGVKIGRRSVWQYSGQGHLQDATGKHFKTRVQGIEEVE